LNKLVNDNVFFGIVDKWLIIRLIILPTITGFGIVLAIPLDIRHDLPG